MLYFSVNVKICDKFNSNNNFGALPSIQSVRSVLNLNAAPPVIVSSSVRWKNGWKSWDHVGFWGENWEILGVF